jgi:hypothetical protein
MQTQPSNPQSREPHHWLMAIREACAADGQPLTEAQESHVYDAIMEQNIATSDEANELRADATRLQAAQVRALNEIGQKALDPDGIYRAAIADAIQTISAVVGVGVPANLLFITPEAYDTLARLRDHTDATFDMDDYVSQLIVQADTYEHEAATILQMLARVVKLIDIIDVSQDNIIDRIYDQAGRPVGRTTVDGLRQMLAEPFAVSGSYTYIQRLEAAVRAICDTAKDDPNLHDESVVDWEQANLAIEYGVLRRASSVIDHPSIEVMSMYDKVELLQRYLGRIASGSVERRPPFKPASAEQLSDLAKRGLLVVPELEDPHLYQQRGMLEAVLLPIIAALPIDESMPDSQLLYPDHPCNHLTVGHIRKAIRVVTETAAIRWDTYSRACELERALAPFAAAWRAYETHTGSEDERKAAGRRKITAKALKRAAEVLGAYEEE